MIWRLDLQLLYMAHAYGIGWAAVTALCLVLLMFMRMDRAMLLGIAILLSGMIWYRPFVALARVLRWWVLIVLAIRGLAFAAAKARSGLTSGHAPLSLIVFSGLMLASCAWAEAPILACVLALSLVCVQMLGFVVVWSLSDDDLLLRRLCSATLLLALLIHGVGLFVAGFALLTGDTELRQLTGVDRRLSGILMNANGNGVFGALFLPLVLAAPSEYLGRLRRWRWVAVTALVVSILLSGSRTGAGIAVLGCAVFVLYRFRVGGFLTVSTLLALGISAAIMMPGEELEGSTLDEVVLRTETLYDFGGRLDQWLLGMDYGMQQPLAGHGWGASKTLYGWTSTEDALLRGSVRFASNLHSTHVSIFVDLGFLGLAAFWAFCGTVLWSGMRVVSAPRTPANTVVVLIFAATLGLVADTFVHNGILSAASSNSLLFWSATAIVIRHARRLRAAESGPQSSAAGGVSVALAR